MGKIGGWGNRQLLQIVYQRCRGVTQFDFERMENEAIQSLMDCAVYSLLKQ